jgi:hypothetical protein
MAFHVLGGSLDELMMQPVALVAMIMAMPGQLRRQFKRP